MGGIAGQHLPVRLRHGQGRHGEDLLALDAEHVPAGGEDAQPRGGGQQLAGQHRAGIGEVLAVVEHHQEALRLEVGREIGGRIGRDLAQLERVGHGVREQLGIVEGGELDEPHAVGEGAADLGGHPECESGLADAPGAGEGEQAAGGQHPPRLGELATPPHEAGHLGGQAPRTDVVGFELAMPVPPLPPHAPRPAAGCRGPSAPSPRRRAHSWPSVYGRGGPLLGQRGAAACMPFATRHGRAAVVGVASFI